MAAHTAGSAARRFPPSSSRTPARCQPSRPARRFPPLSRLTFSLFVLKFLVSARAQRQRLDRACHPELVATRRIAPDRQLELTTHAGIYPVSWYSSRCKGKRPAGNRQPTSGAEIKNGGVANQPSPQSPNVILASPPPLALGLQP